MHDDTIPAYSRATIGGKCDDEIRARVPFELRQKLQQLAHSYGMGESEFVRDVLTVRVYGLEHYQTVLAAHAAAVAGVRHDGSTQGERWLPTGGKCGGAA